MANKEIVDPNVERLKVIEQAIVIGWAASGELVFESGLNPLQMLAVLTKVTEAVNRQIVVNKPRKVLPIGAMPRLNGGK